MIEAEKRIVAWGNSFGIRLSKPEMEAEGIEADDEVQVVVKKKITKAGEIFGKMKHKIDTEKALKEIDKMLGEF